MIPLHRATAFCAISFLVGAALVPTSVFGHEPVANAVREYGQNAPLTYKFEQTGYPAWVKAAVNGTLKVNWPSKSDNNSASPRFSETASGTGRVTYSPLSNSPCSPSPLWLACSSGWGTSSWHIYIRNFDEAPIANWAWYDVGHRCPSGSACFYARRSLIHEAEHVALGVGSHDDQGELNTVMCCQPGHGGQPTSPAFGWNTTTIRRCDEAAAQLLYDVRTTSGPYADCFDHITGHGTTGLVSTATVGSANYSLCQLGGITASGRLAIKTDANYGLLTSNPLTGRKLFFDRRPVGGTWTLNVASTIATATSAPGNNWTKKFSSRVPGTFEFRAHYGGETGVDASNQPTFTITWSSLCTPIFDDFSRTETGTWGTASSGFHWEQFVNGGGTLSTGVDGSSGFIDLPESTNIREVVQGQGGPWADPDGMVMTALLGFSEIPVDGRVEAHFEFHSPTSVGAVDVLLGDLQYVQLRDGGDDSTFNWPGVPAGPFYVKWERRPYRGAGTSGDVSRVKVWSASVPEPADWLLSGFGGNVEQDLWLEFDSQLSFGADSIRVSVDSIDIQGLDPLPPQPPAGVSQGRKGVSVHEPVQVKAGDGSRVRVPTR